MSGLKGDFAKLSRLATKMRPIGTPVVKQQLARLLGAEALAQLQLGFRESRDPYGNAWEGLQLRAGKPLLDTGRMRSSFSVQPSGSGFVVGTNFIGAGVHQHGATIVPVRSKLLRFRAGRRGRWIHAKRVVIPKRQMMPSGTLGPIWTKAFNATATRFISRLLKP